MPSLYELLNGLPREAVLGTTLNNIMKFGEPLPHTTAQGYGPNMMSLSDLVDVPDSVTGVGLSAASMLPVGKLAKAARGKMVNTPPTGGGTLSGGPVRAYHGTNANFQTFDPTKTNDLGMHFGSQEQANNAITRGLRPAGDLDDFSPGANVRPVDLDIKNTVRLPDVFSLLEKGMTTVSKALSLNTPHLFFSGEDQKKLYEIAKRLDSIKKKAGGVKSWMPVEQSTLVTPAQKAEYTNGMREYWNLVQSTIQKNGYDSAVYSNKVEGKGDSHIVFDAAKVLSPYRPK